jgi:hypothetical protein
MSDGIARGQLLCKFDGLSEDLEVGRIDGISEVGCFNKVSKEEAKCTMLDIHLCNKYWK